MIRPGLEKRLAWMCDNVYATYRCGTCLIAGFQCEQCKQNTLKANGGLSLEEFRKRKRDRQ